MKTRTLFSLAVAALVASTTAFSAEGNGSLNDADAKFVKNAVQSGRTEIKIAELGVKKAQNADVKTLAETVIKDHTAINAELEKLAETKGVQLSTAGDPDANDTVADLEKESGADFDKAFLKALKKGHEDSVSAYKDAAEDSTDGDLKAWAGKTLPTIEGHLGHVKSTHDSLK